ncbi:MAG: endolytic transglycosylase MltG [Hyphomonadaceae bacterium]
MAAAEAARRRHERNSPTERRHHPAPKRRRRDDWFSRFNRFLGAVIAIAAVALLLVLGFIVETARPGPNPAEDAVVVIPRGASVTSIGRILETEGFIRNALVFRAATMVYARGRSLQAGEYEIAERASQRQIIEQMANGRSVMHSITIAEGLTSAMAVAILAQSDVLTGDIPPVPPEGAILPETYHVERGMDRTALLRRMMADRDRVLREVWAGRARDLPIRTPQEAVILASIVEKETGVAAERPRVAAVFTNRLRRGMQLESDPTIIYGVCRQHPERCVNGRLVNERTGRQRGIRQSEIDMHTGYNTYRIPRLPPTPIANPGRAALEAVVNPPHTNDLFFVADGTGGHVFAETNAQHEANVRRWRQIEAAGQQ